MGSFTLAIQHTIPDTDIVLPQLVVSHSGGPPHDHVRCPFSSMTCPELPADTEAFFGYPGRH